MDLDERRRLRRHLAWWGVVGTVIGLSVWYGLRDPDPGVREFTGPLPSPALEQAPRSALPFAVGTDGFVPPGGTSTLAPTPSAGPTGAAATATPEPVVTRSVAGGRGTVVAAAVDVAEQAQVRDHWTDDAMATATPASVVVAPAAATTTAVPTTPGSTTAGSTTAATTSAPRPSLSTSPLGGAGGGTTAPEGTSATSALPGVTLAPPSTPEVVTDLGSAWTAGGVVARTTGKVFFTRAGRDYVCSAAALDTPDASTVVTAAHCVVEAGVFASRWVFVPEWSPSGSPHGVFVATHVALPDAFLAGDVSADVAFVNVAPNADGVSLGDAVGGLPIAFSSTPAQVHVLGFPQASPFDGTRLVHCAGTVVPDRRGTTDLGVACAMTAGASGGPWLDGVDAAGGAARVVSVTSFAYADQPGTLFGPPFGEAVRQVYASVARNDEL